MKDFPDWLNPMVVKELRQGLNSRAFVVILLAVQAFLLLLLFASFKPDNRDGATGFFWFVTGILLLAAIPFRGMMALQGEIRDQTLELVQLTHLSSRDVVVGKWLALVLQGFLLLCSILPYLTIRYFLGGIDLVTELTSLGGIMLISATLTALLIGLSAHLTSAISRLLLLFGGIFILPGFLGPLVVFLFGGATRSTLFDRPLFLLLALPFVILFCVQFLELGVSKIAPAGENTTRRRRLLLLAMVALGCACALLGSHREEWLFFTALASAPLLLSFLTEPTPAIASLYRPVPAFLPRPLRWLLFPGWGSGLLLTLLIALLLLTLASFGGSSAVWELKPILLIVSGMGTVALPLAILHLLPRVKAKGILFFCFQGAMFILSVVLYGVFNHRNDDFALSGLLPPLAFYSSFFRTPTWDNSSGVLVFTSISTLLSVVLLVALSVSSWRTLLAMEKAAATLPPLPPPNTPAASAGHVS